MRSLILTAMCCVPSAVAQSSSGNSCETETACGSWNPTTCEISCPEHTTATCRCTEEGWFEGVDDECFCNPDPGYCWGFACGTVPCRDDFGEVPGGDCQHAAWSAGSALPWGSMYTRCDDTVVCK